MRPFLTSVVVVNRVAYEKNLGFYSYTWIEEVKKQFISLYSDPIHGISINLKLFKDNQLTAAPLSNSLASNSFEKLNTLMTRRYNSRFCFGHSSTFVNNSIITRWQNVQFNTNSITKRFFLGAQNKVRVQFETHDRNAIALSNTT